MKKTATMLCASLLLTIGFFSCGKETQSTTQGGGKFYVKAKISPPLQSGKNAMQGLYYNQFQLAIAGSAAKWDGSTNSQILSELVTDEISVTAGQNVVVMVNLANSYDVSCRTVTIEGIQNGRVIKSYTFSMGMSSSSTYCSDGGTQQKNFIID